jgi:hypothetical protein
MNLKIGKSNNRTYLSIVHGYRDRDSGIVKTKTVQSLGYLDDLQKQYPDPIAHFREVARQMTEEENAQRKITLTLDMDERLPMDAASRKNLGYAAILKIYHELELHRFFNNKARHQGFAFNTNSIMQLLVISRLLSPGSKKKAFEEKGRYFERFNFSLADTYRALSHFAKVAKEAQRHTNERICACYGRDTATVYYDVTNFYFEIDAEDELRKYGKGKEHRPSPIAQMGLAMDADGVPLHYEMFAGNTLDKSTFRSVIGEVRRNYNTGRIIVVADMGIITGDNIFYLTGGEKREKPLNGYVFSFSVRGGTESFKKYVLDQNGYHGQDGKPDGKPDGKAGGFMIKSRRIAREINVTMQNGKAAKKTVYEKQVVFWSQKYADKAKADREKTILKAKELAHDPAKYNRATSYGAAKYVDDITFDKKSGEVILADKQPVFNEAKVLEEERYDGYYAIVTSELAMPDQEIIDTYRGLWEIEETFRITKGTLEARPVYVSRKERIEAHFLTCFIALVIVRLLQKQTGHHFSCEKIVDCLNRISCSSEQDNIYLFNYRSKVSDGIGKSVGLDFSKKRLRLSEIKNILASCKQ